MPHQRQPRRFPGRVRVSRGLTGLLSALLLAGCTTVPGPGAQDTAPAPKSLDPDKVFALVPDDETRASLVQNAEEGGYTLLSTEVLDGLGLTLLSFALPPGVTGQEAIVELETAEPAATVGINTAYSLQQGAAIPPGFDYATALLDWPAGGCPARAPIGLIDTAVDAAAGGLAPGQVISRRFAAGPAGQSRHGTEVARVLADPARLRRAVIYNADVIGIGPDGSQTAGAASLVVALDWLSGEGVRIINLSLAGPYNKLLNLAVETAAARGLILVAAAGNAGPASAPQYPAGFEPVIAVTAVDAARQLFPGAVNGAHIDLAAPGVDVFVPYAGSGRFVTGTSIAAPFVTARIAADPDLVAAPNVEVLRRKLTAATEDLGPAGTDPQFGAGLVKARGICGGAGT